MRRIERACRAMLIAAALLPSPAFAQIGASGIAGVVTDTSGAVMPGVTVEATSPVLIEKVRSVVTDDRGWQGSTPSNARASS
jgi:hypothetical protein